MSHLRLSEASIEGGDDALRLTEGNGTVATQDDEAHNIYSLLQRKLNKQDCDALSEVSDISDVGLDDEDPFETTLNSSRTERRKSRRKSCSGAAAALIDCVSKKRMSCVDVMNLLRLYHEQEAERSRNQPTEETIACDIDLDSLSLDQLVVEVRRIVTEVNEMQEEYPKQAAMNHQQDFEEAIAILNNQFHSLKSNVFGVPDTEIPEEVIAIQKGAESFKKVLQEIQVLQEKVEEQIEAVKILQELNTD